MKDQRSIKNTFPEFLKKDVLIAIWKNEKIKKHINQKFNVKGFFFCKLDKKKESFESIHFGKPFTFETFLKGIKNETYSARNSILVFNILLETKDLISISARLVKMYCRLERDYPQMDSLFVITSED